MVRKMKIIRSIMTTMSFVATIGSAHSASYIWDNQQGLVEVKGCKVVEMDSNPFKVSSYTGRDNKTLETLRNAAKVGQSNLPIGSIIRHENGGRNLSGYEYIYVVGVNYSKAPEINRFLTKRNDKNYLFHRSIEEIDDYAIELTKNVSPNWSESLKGMTLVPITRPTVQKVECDHIDSMKGRDYVLFNGYRDGETPLAIGVSIEETGIFRDIKTVSFSSLSNVQNVLASELTPASSNDVDELEAVVEQVVSEIEDEAVVDQVDEEIDDEATVEENIDKSDVLLGIENVICHPTVDLVVRNEELDKVMFTAKRHEPVKVFQSWDGKALEKQRDGSSVVYIKVQFSNREESDQVIGWVSKKYVVEDSECPELEKNARTHPVERISGLDDKKCCDFPVKKVPTHPYTGSGAGMRQFRAGRKGGRLHAACELYRYRGEETRAVAAGKVIDRDHFYEGTSQITLKHDGGFVVRYGEIISGERPDLKLSRRNGHRWAKMGDKIGEIGVVNSGCCRPMLHFELYKGNLSGPLSIKYRNMRGKFGRRDDLMNPTSHLVKWQNEIF